MYQSPIRLYQHLNIADNLLSDASQLQKVKKLINAEFAIADNGIISIDNIDYNKADILTNLDSENFLDKYNVHLKIWNIPSLLHFLEDSKFEVALIKYDEWREILNSEIFHEFFANDFALAFNKCSSQYIYEFNFYMLGEMMKVGLFIQDEYFDEAFQNMRLFIDSGTKLFKNTNKENCSTNPEFERWVYNDFGKFISKLPYGFSENINSFAAAAINLTVELQKLKQSYSVRISHQLTYLLDIVHPDYADLIKKNHDVFVGNDSESKGWFSGSARYILIGLVIAIRVFASMSNCNNHSHVEYNTTSPSIVTVDSSLSKIIDSLNMQKYERIRMEAFRKDSINRQLSN